LVQPEVLSIEKMKIKLKTSGEKLREKNRDSGEHEILQRQVEHASTETHTHDCSDSEDIRYNFC
jgi:hypothetical protein